MTKPCISCGKQLKLLFYYRHKGTVDGYLNKCKACVISYQKKRRRKIIQDIKSRLAERKRGRDKYHRLYKSRKRAVTKATRIKYQRHNSNKIRARYTVANALRDKRLIKSPCKICGVLEVEAHHPNYDEPLNVTWLCRPCHNELHHRID